MGYGVLNPLERCHRTPLCFIRDTLETPNKTNDEGVLRKDPEEYIKKSGSVSRQKSISEVLWETSRTETETSTEEGS